MKKVFLISVSFFTLTTFAQNKVVEIKPTGKNKFLGYESTDNGMFYIITGQDKKPKSEVKILSYDQDLNLNYEKDIASNYEGLPAFFGRGMNDSPIYYEICASKTGNYSIAQKDRLIIDKKGNHKEFNFKKEDETGGIQSYFTFFSDEFACYLGKKEKGKGKNKQVDDNIYFFRRSLSDQSTKLITLEIPVIESSKDKLEFGLHSYDENGFYIIHKQLDKNAAVDIYAILNYDYEGQLISSKKLEVTLKDKYFAASNCGFGSATIIYSDYSTVHKLSDNATGNVYIDNLTKEYYVFGVYTNTKDMNLYNSRNNGFYIKKYDFDGKLIWSSENSINDKDYNKNAVAYHTVVSFYKLNEKQLGIQISNSKHNYSHMFLLNNEDGKAIENKKVNFSVSAIMLNGIRGGSFKTGYNSKDDFGKNNLNKDTFFADFVSTEVESFFKSVKNKKNNYNCYVLKNGVYILEEDFDASTFRLLKFDLN